MYHWQAELEGGRAFLSLGDYQFLISKGADTWLYKWTIEPPFFTVTRVDDEQFNEMRDVFDHTYPDTHVCESKRWEPLGPEGFDESMMPEWAKAAFHGRKDWESSEIPGNTIFNKEENGVRWYTLWHNKSNRTCYMEFEGHILSGGWARPVTVFNALVTLSPEERGGQECSYETYLAFLMDHLKALREKTVKKEVSQ